MATSSRTSRPPTTSRTTRTTATTSTPDPNPTPAAPVVPLPAFGPPSVQFGSVPRPNPNPTAENPEELGSLKDGPNGPVLMTPSSAGKHTPSRDERAHAGKLVKGLLGALIVLTDGLMRRYAKRDLRRPTDENLEDFSNPIGQILARHVDLSALGPDLMDITDAASAAGEYLIDGPVSTLRRPESAVPDWTAYQDDDDPSEPAQPLSEPVIDPTTVSFLS